MQFSKRVRQFWPLTIVTIAIVLGLPILTGNGEKRSGLAGITSRASSFSGDGESLNDEALSNKHQAGYTRPDGMLPLYGFDGVVLSTPIFKSWWDGNAVVAGAKLRELHSNTVVLDQIWKDTNHFHDTVARLHGAGLKIILQVTDTQDWVEMRDDATGKSQPMPFTFVTSRASRMLAEAKAQGVGRFADYILVGGEALSFANQLQRQKMYEVTKQYFPDTPIVRRYGADIQRAEGMQGKAHHMGGVWDEYRFGPDECDIALVTVGRGVDENRVGVRVANVLEQLNHIVSIVKSRHNSAGIIVTARLGDEKLLSNNKGGMWSSKEIDQFVSAILTSAAVDGLVIKGLGLYAYDLGHPDFVAQRQAFRDAAPSLSPTEVATQAEGVGIDRAPASVPGAASN